MIHSSLVTIKHRTLWYNIIHTKTLRRLWHPALITTHIRQICFSTQATLDPMGMLIRYADWVVL